MFLVQTLLNLVIYVRNVHRKKTQKHCFPFIHLSIYLFTVVSNLDKCKGSPQITDDQNSFSMPSPFVLISHHLKPLTEKSKN